MQAFYNLDLKIFTALNGSAGISQFSNWAIIFLANYLPYLVILGLLIWLWRANGELKVRLQIGVVSLLSGLVARFGVAELIRFFYHRPRPFVYHSVTRLFSESSYSFPSGHSIFFFALAAAVYCYNRRAGNWLFVLAVIIGVARIASGVHYPSDILAGAALGLLTAYLIVRFPRPVFTRFFQNF